MASLIPATVHVRESWQTAGAVPLRIDIVDFSEGNSGDAPGNHFVLCFVLRGCGDIRSSFNGLKPRNQYFRAGMFVPVTPPDVSADFWMSAPMRHLMLTVPEATFAPWKSSDANPCQSMPHEDGFEDALLSEIVRAFWREAKENNGNGMLYADSLRMALAAALIRRANDGTAQHQRTRRLSRSELASLQDFLSDRLDDDVCLADLATHVQMKERSFVSAFKSATGQTPYQYLIRMRVERAKDYLANSKMTLWEIADATGFVDQAHLTSVFRRHMGLPPAKYRASLKF
ncbi:MAG: AraC family transcriptional regulator [Hyphomicrobium sp.]|uniref:helix-turn-helix domain-containing protein n=1 Tax=Hyphomicrobium sp. TaxID=82 RepID=UPI0039E317AA